MDWETAFKLVAGFVATMMGWHIQRLTADIDLLRRSFNDISLKIAQDYVHKDSLAKLEDRIDKRFDKQDAILKQIFEELKLKADKL